MKFVPTIGLEVHVQLSTKSKMFCRCSAEVFGADPNTHTCPVCLGLPGALPVPNAEAVKLALLAGETLGSQHPSYSKFDRKNYFYPDLPKGYQISQFDLPLNTGGKVSLGDKNIAVTRAHLEEDTGKLLHQGAVSLIDYNRSGIPLLEIVSEPQIESAEEAKLYGQKIQQLMRYAGVSEADMEKGSLRVDANVSVRSIGQKDLGSKVEIKNMNSFRAVEKALNFEIDRQTKILEKDQPISQETRGWDEGTGQTVPQRIKEESADYRYFPEPDIPAMDLSEKVISEVKKLLPELPEAKTKRLIKTLQLPAKDAATITSDRNLALFYEEALGEFEKVSGHKISPDTARKVTNWTVGDFLYQMNSQNISWETLPITPAHLAELIYLFDQGKITAANAKIVLGEMMQTGDRPAKVITDKGFVLQSDAIKLSDLAKLVISQNPDAANDYRSGKEQALSFLLGKILQETKGQADPTTARQALKNILDS